MDGLLSYFLKILCDFLAVFIILDMFAYFLNHYEKSGFMIFKKTLWIIEPGIKNSDFRRSSKL